MVWTVHLNAQVEVVYVPAEVEQVGILQTEFQSHEALHLYMQEITELQREDGFLSFSIDSIVSNDNDVFVYIHQGHRYTKSFGALEQRRMLSQLGQLEDSGHPFATLRITQSLDSVLLGAESLISPGPFIVFDSLILLQSPVLPAKVIGCHLGIHSGKPYSEKLVMSADKRLRKLPFIKVVRPTSVIFAKDRARVLLSVEKRNANQVDGIIGFQPDSDGKVSFTGELKLDLYNSFSHLDNIFLQWQRVADNTQDIEFRIRYPYLFSSTIGVRAGIEQFRQDTTFNQVELAVGLFSVLENGSELSIQYARSSANDLLGPSNVDGRSSSSAEYGVGYEMIDVDDPFNPLTGIIISSAIWYGDKEIKPTDIEQSAMTVDQWKAALTIENFIPVKTRSTLLIRGRVHHIESEIVIFNELERIGGLHTLRGVDEQSISASSFGILTSEFRYLTDERSYLSAFIDYAWYERSTELGYIRDNPYGIGVGAAFSTRSGVLNINYALGSQFGQALSFATGKVHFGYTALF